MDRQLRGSIVALITPFLENGEVDHEALEKLIAWHIQEGTDGVVCCGTTGEAPTLSHEEQMEIFRTAVRVGKGKIPIIAGTGTYNTKTTVEKTQEAADIGVDAALVVVPYYSRPTPEGCLAHYRAVDKVGLPWILYHHPGRTGIRLGIETLVELCQLPHIAAIKEASGTLEITEKLFPLIRTPIFSGDDHLTLSLMARGAVGVISIVANLIPREWRALVRSQRTGAEIDKKYVSLCQAMVLETNPQCVKYALSLMDKCLPHLRLPLVEPRQTTKEKIAEALVLCQTRIGDELGF